MRRTTPIYRLALPISEYDNVKANPAQGFEITIPMNNFNLSYWTAAITGAEVWISRGLTNGHQTRHLVDIMRDSTSFKLILSPSEAYEPIY